MNPKCNYECCSLPDCRAKNKDGFTCTRNLGHEGDHVACGIAEHDLCIWPQETPIPVPVPVPTPVHIPVHIPVPIPQPAGKALFYATVEKALEEYASKRHMPRKDIVTLLHEHLMKVYPS
jgi:hypothetical protein